MLHPRDLEHHFVQMPFVANPRKATTDLIGELLAEFARPLPHGFVADDDAAGSEQLLHHAETKREAEIKPCGMADNLGRNRMAPLYVARIEELGHGDFVKVDCAVCHHV